MRTRLIFDPDLSAEEMRGFTRTIAEIEWLMLILVLLYQVVMQPDGETSAALAMAMYFFAAFVVSFHYANFYRRETTWKLAIEVWAMIIFITWVLAYTGGPASPLHDLYVLVIVVSALTLGKIETLAHLAVIVLCYVWLVHADPARSLNTGEYFTSLAAKLSPVFLVAYITTMLSSDIRRAIVQIKALSETDELTGALNMRAFSSVCERMFRQAARYARPISVLMIDSDGLKEINDTHGHETGNRMLKLTVQCIQDQMRETDVLARYGGDEFVLLLPETDCNGAMGVAKRIQQSVAAALLPTREKKVPFSVSIGIACSPEHGHSLETIMERADQAMYVSKNDGKNRATVHTARQPLTA